MKRLFVAIKVYPDKNFLTTYRSLQHALQLEKISWVKPDNFHLTLKFLGKTQEEKLPLIRTTLQETVQKNVGFPLTFSGTGIFGSAYKPRVIWFGTEPNATLQKMGEQILDALDDAGFPRDRQNFVPHLTIGRIRKIEHKKNFQQAVSDHRNDFLQTINVDNIILYESLLRPEGAIYRPVYRFKLKK